MTGAVRVSRSAFPEAVALLRRTLDGAALMLALGVAGCGTPPPGYEAPPPLPTGVVAEVRERPYRVQGVTEAEIARSLAMNRRPGEGGGRYSGSYSWQMRWSFQYGPARGGCRMRSVRLRLRSEMQLPEWVDRERADSALIAAWDTYIERLRRHENRHQVHAHSAARDVYRMLKRFTAPTCATMESRANARARRILERYREKDRRYDEETRHGLLEGVAWPPRRADSLRARVSVEGGGPDGLRR